LRTDPHVGVFAGARVDQPHDELSVLRHGEESLNACVGGFADGAVGGGELFKQESVLVVELLCDQVRHFVSGG